AGSTVVFSPSWSPSIGSRRTRRTTWRGRWPTTSPSRPTDCEPSMRLSNATVAEHLAPQIERFIYNRSSQKVGIVHFGIGAFHRAHQAWYTDRAMDSGEQDWAISGVSLRSPSVSNQLNPQDCFYTLTERSGGEVRT